MTNITKILSIFFLLFFTGCTLRYPVVFYPKKLSKDTVKEYKNYSVNKKTLAFVGQPLFRIKSEYLVQHQVYIVKPLNDFIINTETVSFTIESQQSYRVNAIFENFDKLINVDASREFSYSFSETDHYLIVNKEGMLLPKLWNVGNTLDAKISTKAKFEITPKKIYLQEEKNEQLLNIELLYNGTNKDGIKLLYREYTSANYARPAFYQNLIYDTNEKEIRFKNFLIKIHSSNNQEIVFTILRDDFKSDQIIIK